MTSLGFANTHRLAVGVHLPTDCGRVLPRWALGLQIMAWRGVGDRSAYPVDPIGASELLSNQSPKRLPNTSSGISLLYFPL
jgi:hypothetical protein